MTDVLRQNKMSNKVLRAQCRLVKLSVLLRCSLLLHPDTHLEQKRIAFELNLEVFHGPVRL